MAKSPSAVKLDEILQSLKQNNQEIPESLKALQAQASAERAESKRPKNPRGAGLPPERPKTEEPVAQESKPAVVTPEPIVAPPKQEKTILQRLLSKNTSKKLVKEPATGASAEVLSLHGDIKQIKADVKDIKSRMSRVRKERDGTITKVRGPRRKRDGSITKFGKHERRSFEKNSDLRHMIEGVFNEHLGHMSVPFAGNLAKGAVGGVKKVARRLFKGPEPKADTMVGRIATSAVPAAVDRAKNMLNVDTGKKDQADVVTKNIEAKHSDEVKKTEAWQLGIKKELDDIKKHSNGMVGLLIAGIGMLFAKLGIGKLIKGFFKLNKLLLSQIPKMLSMIGRIPGVGKLGAVAASGIVGYEIGKALDKKYQLHEKVGDVVQGVQDYNKQQEKNEDYASDIEAGKPTTREGAIKKGVESWYEGGDRESPQFLSKKEKDESLKLGNKLKEGDPKEAQNKMLEQNASKVKAAADKKGTIVRPVPSVIQKKEPETPKRLESVTAENNELEDAESDSPIVVVQAPAPPAVAPVVIKQQGPSVAVVAARNPESSITRLGSTLFDDPAGYNSLARI